MNSLEGMNVITTNLQQNRFNKASRQLRLVAFLVVVCIVGALFANVTYVVTHYHHHCTGQHCSVCEKIEASIDNIVKIGKSLCMFSIVLILGSGAVSMSRMLSSFHLEFSTPVKNKVRMND